MLKNLMKGIIILFVLVLVDSSQAAVYNLSATLDGGQEVPPSLSTATGTMTGTLDDVTNLFNWNITFSGLAGTETAAHFHQAPAGVNGPVIINLPIASPKVGSQTITAEQAEALIGGNIYTNIHSIAYPGGEIRGQISAVLVGGAAIPTLSEWGVIFLSLLILTTGIIMMRKQQKVTAASSGSE